MSPADTIVAIASPVGRGAVGIVRVSGPAVPEIATRLLGRLPTARTATLARFQAADGGSVDQGLALYFAAPASFTGEHVLELQGHGGAVVQAALVERLLELGCRAAQPGEFSERAFCNGKLDLAQAEAVPDLIDAGTTAAARAAVRSLQGEFSARVQELLTRLTELRIYVEASIDFPDEDLDPLGDVALADRLQRLFASFDALGSAAKQGALLRDGLTVVLAGKPNAGKSSLMNALAGDEIAIVSETPGTTRDVLRQGVQIGGMPLHLIDTAGLRTALDAVEAEGIRRAQREMLRADRVLYVVDASEGGGPTLASGTRGSPGGRGADARSDDPPPDDLAARLAGLPGDVPVTVVYNKIDLVGLSARLATDSADDAPPQIFLSARTGAGIELLREHLRSSAGLLEGGASALAARGRHLDALQRARAHAQAAADALRNTRAMELFAEELRLAQQALGEITGEFTSDDLLGQIFRSFCIGK
jgi:tRNA modification GTPase